MWAVLERFGYKAAFEELNGSGIHCLKNVITLDHNVHFFFDTLQLWLEPKAVSVILQPVPIGALTGFLGHTQHLQTLRGSNLLYRQSLEDYCNIHNSGF